MGCVFSCCEFAAQGVSENEFRDCGMCLDAIVVSERIVRQDSGADRELLEQAAMLVEHSSRCERSTCVMPSEYDGH